MHHSMSFTWKAQSHFDVKIQDPVISTPQPFKAFGVLFLPMASEWSGGQEVGQWEKACPGYISEIIWCRKLKLDRNID